MAKIDEYRMTLQKLANWIPYLLDESGLPGPRGNLELAHAVAQEGSKEQFEKFLTSPANENTPEVFVVFCGVMGLGKLAGREPALFDRLREYASDPRWRVREAVATGLQLTGDQDMALLLREMEKWSKGNWYEKRAAAAALAEPRLLKQTEHARQTLQILDGITAAMESAVNRKDESFQILRQGMGYCWSVAVVALPEAGKPMMEKWLSSQNKDIHWMMKENLKKNRLIKMNRDWVKTCQQKLEQVSSIYIRKERIMPPKNDLPLVFEQLKNILKPYAEKLTLKTDTSDSYYIDGPYSEKWKKELFFGSTQIKKNYVSFYLMPVYMYPELLDDVSPELKKRMQGKSCFNFKKVEPALFAELAALTRMGADKFNKENAE